MLFPESDSFYGLLLTFYIEGWNTKVFYSLYGCSFLLLCPIRVRYMLSFYSSLSKLFLTLGVKKCFLWSCYEVKGERDWSIDG